MKVIRIHHPYNNRDIPMGKVVLALGFFDGVHRGHQKVIGTAKKIAREKNLKLAVMTFNQHPSIVFNKKTAEGMTYLSTVKKKEDLMAELGTDYLYEVDFTSEFAALSPQEFVDQYVVGLHSETVVAGFDYTYGKKEVAAMHHLPNYAKGRFDIVVVQEQTVRGGKISSTRIRASLEVGDMEEANDLLGYVYETPGVVVHGDARGRLLGFPTANIKTDPFVRLPGVGVYAVMVCIHGKWYRGMASIGHNITFEPGRPLTVEVYVLDFQQDIYGEEVVVQWFSYLRGEVKFSSVEKLIEQLKQDEVDTADYFNKKLEETN